jgi:glutamyl-tRNA reductase
VHWLGQRHTVPLIQALHQQADSWRQAEIQRARKLLAKGQDIDTVLEALSRGLTQKMLHGAMAELNASDGDQRLMMAQTVSRLFLRNTPTDLPVSATGGASLSEASVTGALGTPSTASSPSAIVAALMADEDASAPGPSRPRES